MADEIDQSMNEYGQDQEENGVIKALRKQVKDLEAALRSAPQREVLEGEIRALLARESTAASLLVEKGQPAALAEFALQKIGDAEVTEESIVSFLSSQGFRIPEAQSDGSDSEQSEERKALAEVTKASSALASASKASSGTVPDNLDRQIAEAQTPSELEAIMARAGLAHS